MASELRLAGQPVAKGVDVGREVAAQVEGLAELDSGGARASPPATGNAPEAPQQVVEQTFGATDREVGQQEEHGAGARLGRTAASSRRSI